MQPQSTIRHESIGEVFAYLEEIVEILRRHVEFGNPAHPYDTGDTSRAGALATSHNGSLDNVFGSWVEAQFTVTDLPATTCYHNLDITPTAGQLNVRWIVFGMTHDGTGVNAASTLSVNYTTGDAVTNNSIDLRLYAGGTRTVGVANPVKVTLFFIPAVRG